MLGCEKTTERVLGQSEGIRVKGERQEVQGKSAGTQNNR